MKFKQNMLATQNKVHRVIPNTFFGQFFEGSDHRVSIIKALSISKLLKELKMPFFSHTSLEA